MGLLAVLNLKQIDIPEPVAETERSGGGKGGKGGAAAPKVAQVAVEPEIEKTGGKGATAATTTEIARREDRRQGGESDPEKAKSTPAEVKAKSDFQKARDATRKLIDELNANAQRGVIMAQINQATAKLAEADAHAAKLEFPQANAALAAAGAICADARKLADDWGAYAKLRASCAAMVSAFKGFDTAAVTAALNTTIAQADALVAADAAEVRRRHRQAADDRRRDPAEAEGPGRRQQGQARRPGGARSEGQDLSRRASSPRRARWWRRSSRRSPTASGASCSAPGPRCPT